MHQLMAQTRRSRTLFLLFLYCDVKIKWTVTNNSSILSASCVWNFQHWKPLVIIGFKLFQTSVGVKFRYCCYSKRLVNTEEITLFSSTASQYFILKKS